MIFPWDEELNHPTRVGDVITILQSLELHDSERKMWLLAWAKEVGYPYTHDLFLWVWEEITETEYRQRQPAAP